jgi:hypothetical protein
VEIYLCYKLPKKNPSGQWALLTTLQLVMSTSIHHQSMKNVTWQQAFFYWQNLAKKRNSNFKIQKSSDFRFFHSLEVTPKKNSENCQISILGFKCVAKV